MIDINKAEEEFKRYVSEFDMEELHLYRKVNHTFRVMGLCEKLALSIGMNEEYINLAKLIGLLHDIARFEQYKTYNTFDDMKNIDHGDFAIEILEKNNYIRKYIKTNEYDEIILKAVRNHNKYEIESGINEREILFCQIVRDADKLDIMYQGINESWENDIKEIENQEITPKVVEQFLSQNTINRVNVKELIDRIIVHIAFLYDLNFKESYKIIKENDYINKIFDRFNFEKEETKKQMDLIRETANEYISKEL